MQDRRAIYFRISNRSVRQNSMAQRRRDKRDRPSHFAGFARQLLNSGASGCALLFLNLQVCMNPGIHQIIQGHTRLHLAVVKCVVLLSAPSNHFALLVVER